MCAIAVTESDADQSGQTRAHLLANEEVDHRLWAGFEVIRAQLHQSVWGRRQGTSSREILCGARLYFSADTALWEQVRLMGDEGQRDHGDKWIQVKRSQQFVARIKREFAQLEFIRVLCMIPI
ncbi:hypothetical protein EYF80_022950 [Liparis tanakae]|uniref:Uncharacterized protein n=1 Tax=Liparis tanakae TaxID=230148 RepID=A0A4Z2HMW4_9TELE|nr:hypothetical protein EYF80_022950 [Liparis tanakae]